MGLRRRIVPAIFTALYFAAAIVFGPVIDRGSWISIGTPFLLIFATLSSGLLWIAYEVSARKHRRRSAAVWVFMGILCPFAVTLGPFRLLKASQAYAERRTARQLAASHLSNIHDEPFLGLNGHPIGIRIAYSVTYDEGLDDTRYSPFSTVHVDAPMTNLIRYSAPK